MICPKCEGPVAMHRRPVVSVPEEGDVWTGEVVVALVATCEGYPARCTFQVAGYTVDRDYILTVDTSAAGQFLADPLLLPMGQALHRYGDVNQSPNKERLHRHHDPQHDPGE